MAETYFNYQPRDPQVQVNWAEAASNLTNVVKEEADTRIKKKAAIDESTRQYQKELNDKPQGESTSIREWGLQFGDEAQKQMMMLTKMLKSGQMSVADYTINKQNLVDGTEEAFSLMSEYNNVYDEKMARMKSQDPNASSQMLETWLMENAEGYGNFNKSQVVINPETGKVSVAFKVKNPKTGLMEISTNPNELVAVSALKGQIAGNFDKYNVEENTRNFVDNLGIISNVAREVGDRRKAGQILTTIGKIPAQYDAEGKRIMSKVTPAMAKEFGMDVRAVGAINDYIKAEDNWIDGQLSNPYNMTSVLTDFVSMGVDGKNYSFTYDIEEAKENSNLILMKREGGGNVPVFDEDVNPHAKEQKEEIRNYMKYSIRSKVDEQQTIQTYNDYKAPPQPQKWENDAATLKEEKRTIAQLWNRLGNAPEAEKQEITDAILGTNEAKNSGLTGIVFSKDGKTISYQYLNTDKNRKDVPIPSTAQGWVDQGSEIHGLQGKDAKAGFNYDSYVSEGFNSVSSKRKGKSGISENFNSRANQALNKIPDLNQSGKNVKAKIQSAISALGGTVVSVKGNTITIMNAGGKGTYEVNTKGGDEEKQAMIDFLKNISEADKVEINKKVGSTVKLNG